MLSSVFFTDWSCMNFSILGRRIWINSLGKCVEELTGKQQCGSKNEFHWNVSVIFFQSCSSTYWHECKGIHRFRVLAFEGDDGSIWLACCSMVDRRLYEYVYGLIGNKTEERFKLELGFYVHNNCDRSTKRRYPALKVLFAIFSLDVLTAKRSSPSAETVNTQSYQSGDDAGPTKPS